MARFELAIEGVGVETALETAGVNASTIAEQLVEGADQQSNTHTIEGGLQEITEAFFQAQIYLWTGYHKAMGVMHPG